MYKNLLGRLIDFFHLCIHQLAETGTYIYKIPENQSVVLFKFPQK